MPELANDVAESRRSLQRRLQRHFPPPMYVQFDGHVYVTPPELLLDDDEEDVEELGAFGSVQ
jgi:hypothetical protein